MRESAEERGAATVTQAKLLRAAAGLDAAIEALLKMEFGASGDIAPHAERLRESAELLEEVRRATQAGRIKAGLSKALLEQLVRGVQARARQAQLLLDSGTALCRGWLLAAPPALPDYTPAGVWADVYEPSHLRYEA
jgi:hypothetical protein